ncbi:MAG: helix-turn-helix transcriptional regulator [Candidatus Krumholzibacteriia bacterium]
MLHHTTPSGGKTAWRSGSGRLFEVREAQGLGLRVAAEHLGISPTYLSRIERGKNVRRLKLSAGLPPFLVAIEISCFGCRKVQIRNLQRFHSCGTQRAGVPSHGYRGRTLF